MKFRRRKGGYAYVGKNIRRMARIRGLMDPVRCLICGHIYDRMNHKHRAKHIH